MVDRPPPSEPPTGEDDAAKARATVVVEEVIEVTRAHEAAIARLLPQLSLSATPPDLAELSAMVAGGQGVHLFSAHLRPADHSPADQGPAGHSPADQGPLQATGDRLATDQPVGFAVLVVFNGLTGRRGWLEDVVVDEEARGHGVGTRLVQAVAKEAGRQGCRTLDLTSRPSREAANRLYERCGFVRRTTNVWRLEL